GRPSGNEAKHLCEFLAVCLADWGKWFLLGAGLDLSGSSRHERCAVTARLKPGPFKTPLSRWRSWKSWRNFPSSRSSRSNDVRVRADRGWDPPLLAEVGPQSEGASVHTTPGCHPGPNILCGMRQWNPTFAHRTHKDGAPGRCVFNAY